MKMGWLREKYRVSLKTDNGKLALHLSAREKKTRSSFCGNARFHNPGERTWYRFEKGIDRDRCTFLRSVTNKYQTFICRYRGNILCSIAATRIALCRQKVRVHNARHYPSILFTMTKKKEKYNSKSTDWRSVL